MDNNKQDVFWQEEIAANRLMAIALLVCAMLFAVVCTMVELEIFYVYRWNPLAIRILLLFVEILMISGMIVAKRYKYEKPWLKVALMTDFLFAVAVMDMVFTYTVSIMVAVPIVLSSRYFSKNYTAKVALVSFVLFFFSAILGALYGNYDANNLQLPPHTIIDMGEEIWITDVMDVGGIEYDSMLMVKNVLLYAYLPKFLQMNVMAAVSFIIADHGRNMVFKQQALTENTARVDAELNLATKIQADMLPSIFPAYPERSEFDIFAQMTPAKEVGGDFYDFFLVDDDHLALVMADVAGKGVPAAMFMMASKNIIANNVMLGKSPAKALYDANNAVCANNSEDMFVTVWLGILEISTGKLVCANAAHDYPVFMTGGGDFELYKDKHGLAVGFFEESEYEEYEIQLQPGDKVFVYTDGLPEATNSKEELFGTDRMVAVLNKQKDASCEEILSNIWRAVGEFVGDAEQFDDLTMLTIEYNGEGGAFNG